MANTAPQVPALGALENLAWTALSVGAAAMLLPVIGLKALSKAALPKGSTALVVEERHYLIQ